MTTTPDDLARLTGVRSGKRSYYREYVRSDERLQQTVRALDSISRALVRTVEGPRGLLDEIARAAGMHLSASCVVLGLADDRLPRARPRFVAVDAQGRTVSDEADLSHDVRLELGAIRAGLARPGLTDTPWVRVMMTLEGRSVGSLVARHGLDQAPEPGDLSVLRILANQAAVSLHTSEQYQAGLDLHRRAQQLYDEATAQARDLAQRTSDLRRTEQRLFAAHQRELLDEERHRIARELHDSVSQLVLSAGMSVEIARGDLEHPELDRAKTLTTRALRELRDTIDSLHHFDAGDDPAPLDQLLAEIVAHHRQRLDVTLRVRGADDAPALPPAVEHELARIAGEALFNVASHSRATHAVVTYTATPERVVLGVADDGNGDPATLRRVLGLERGGPDAGHHGLRNMADRAELVGARLSFRRARIGGVQVVVTLDRHQEAP